MPLAPLDTWKQTLKALPPSPGPSWAPAFASWYADQVALITPAPAFTAAGFVFTFPTPLFAAQLMALPPVPDPISGIMGFANAWQTAIAASVLVVGPGSFLGSPAPPTLFSVVISSLLDPPSILLGYAKILELTSAPPAKDAMDSKFPQAFRDATLQLTFTAIGINSVPPPAGPEPLLAPLNALN